jgi:type II secretory pathway component PulK
MRGAQGAASIMSTLALVVVVILLPTLYASFYASYRDVFADQPAE